MGICGGRSPRRGTGATLCSTTAPRTPPPRTSFGTAPGVYSMASSIQARLPPGSVRSRWSRLPRPAATGSSSTGALGEKRTRSPRHLQQRWLHGVGSVPIRERQTRSQHARNRGESWLFRAALRGKHRPAPPCRQCTCAHQRVDTLAPVGRPSNHRYRRHWRCRPDYNCRNPPRSHLSGNDSSPRPRRRVRTLAGGDGGGLLGCGRPGHRLRQSRAGPDTRTQRYRVAGSTRVTPHVCQIATTQ